MSGRIKNPERVRWRLKTEILMQHGSETTFAELMGISRAQLTHIIVGRNPGWHIRKKSAQLLNRSEEWLFKLGGDKVLRSQKIYFYHRTVMLLRKIVNNIYKFFVWLVT